MEPCKTEKSIGHPGGRARKELGTQVGAPNRDWRTFFKYYHSDLCVCGGGGREAEDQCWPQLVGGA